MLSLFNRGCRKDLLYFGSKTLFVRDSVCGKIKNVFVFHGKMRARARVILRIRIRDVVKFPRYIRESQALSGAAPILPRRNISNKPLHYVHRTSTALPWFSKSPTESVPFLTPFRCQKRCSLRISPMK